MTGGKWWSVEGNATGDLNITVVQRQATQLGTVTIGKTFCGHS